MKAMRARRDRVELTVGFIDLSGFTALTDAHGDSTALDVLDGFEQLARRALTSGDRLVKGIGDAFMLSFPEPDAALDAMECLQRDWASQANVPLLRGGLHHGPAVVRDDDLFGATVNLAARVAAQARGGQLLATSVVAEVARSREFVIVDIGPTQLHNITDPVDLYEIIIEGGGAATIDPVCRMRVPDDLVAARIEIDGHSYRFCSADCAAMFVANRQTRRGC